MPSPSTALSPLGSRFRKSVPSVALAATALVGGATVLYGGQAQAFSCSFGGSGMPPNVCQTDVWYSSNPASDKLVKFLNLPTTGRGDIEFRYADNPPPGLSLYDQWFVDVDFNPNLNPGNGASVFDYLIKIDPTAVPRFPVFWDVSLGASTGGDAWATKEIWATDGNGNKTNLLHTLKYDPFNGITDVHYNIWPTNNLSELYIRDTANPGTFVNGGNIDAYQNTFRQVPGPLPLLSAGAAFGFTRKLRRRVKAFRMA